jgi:hypothetical protein
MVGSSLRPDAPEPDAVLAPAVEAILAEPDAVVFLTDTAELNDCPALIVAVGPSPVRLSKTTGCASTSSPTPRMGAMYQALAAALRAASSPGSE